MEPDESAREWANLLVGGMNAKALLMHAAKGLPTDHAALESALREFAANVRDFAGREQSSVHGLQWPKDAGEKASRVLELLDARSTQGLDDEVMRMANECLAFLFPAPND